MFRSIVWGTDGSLESDRALPTVLDLAREAHATVTLVHVEEHFRGSRVSGEPVFADEPEIRAKIKEQLATLQDAGIAAEL